MTTEAAVAKAAPSANLAATAPDPSELEPVLERRERDHFSHASTHLGQFARGEPPRRVVAGGEGVYIEDGAGHRLLDAFAGPYCVNVGHGTEAPITPAKTIVDRDRAASRRLLGRDRPGAGAPRRAADRRRGRHRVRPPRKHVRLGPPRRATGPDHDRQGSDVGLRAAVPSVAAAPLERGVVARAMPEGDIPGFAPPPCPDEDEAATIVEAAHAAVAEVLGGGGQAAS